MATSLQIKDHWAEQRLFTRRVIVSGILVLGLAALLLLLTISEATLNIQARLEHDPVLCDVVAGQHRVDDL